MKFKKTLLSLALLAGVSAGAQANVLTFQENDGDVITFDGWDFSVNTATAIQTDSAPMGTLAGTEQFVEFGGFSTITLNLNGLPNAAAGVGPVAKEYDMFVNYTLTGSVQSALVFGSLVQQIAFSSGTATFMLEDDVGLDADGVLQPGADVSTLFTASLSPSGSQCNLGSTIDAGTSAINLVAGGCTAKFGVDVGSVANGKFFSDGNDWDTLSTINISASLDIVSLTGLFFNYAAQEAVLADGLGIQTFEIVHDASASFSIPEPASIAVMGLGLLGLGGFARRRK